MATYKAKIRLYGVVHEVVHNGYVLEEAERLIQEVIDAKAVRSRFDFENQNVIVVDIDLGYEIRLEIISNRKLPERKHSH